MSAPATNRNSSAAGVVDGRAIQAQFTALSAEKEKYVREREETEQRRAKEEHAISHHRHRHSILQQQIQSQSLVLGAAEKDMQLLREREKRLRRQHADESRQMTTLQTQIDQKEQEVTERKVQYHEEVDGLNAELDSAMNRYDEGRIISVLTGTSIGEVVLPQIQMMLEVELSAATAGEAGGNVNVNGGIGTDPAAAASTITARGKQLEDLSDQISASLTKLKNATTKLADNRKAKAEAQKGLGPLRFRMMQGRNRDGRLFSELDLNELESKWEAEYQGTDDDEVEMNGENGRGNGRAGHGGVMSKTSASTASMDLFYNTTSDEQDFENQQGQGGGLGIADMTSPAMMMMEEGLRGHAGGAAASSFAAPAPQHLPKTLETIKHADGAVMMEQ